MKVICGAFQVLCLMIFLLSCSGERSYEDALSTNRERFEDPKAFEDARFLVDMKSSVLLQIRLTQLALDTGYSAAVVDFGRSQVQELKNLDNDLNTVARKANIALPARMSDAHASLHNSVETSNRQELDSRLMQSLRSLNQQNITQFEAMATNASHEEVRAFAARKLDILRTHAQRIAAVEQALLNPS